MKIKCSCLLHLAAIVYTTAFTQPVIKTQRVAGGSENDGLRSMAITKDGGLIVGGMSVSNISGEKTENSRGYHDYWIVKYDSEHNIQWDKTMGGSGEDWLTSLQQTSDGGYILGGISESKISGEKTENSRGSFDYWIVKLDSKRNIQWDKTIGGSDYDGLSSLQQTSDGGYILAGYSPSGISGEKTESSRGSYDYWIVKLDSTGTIQWDKTIGGNYLDYLSSLQQASDGGYILGGASDSKKSGEKTQHSRGGTDFWVVKLDSSGTIQWDRTIGGSFDDGLSSLQQTNNGGYILGGVSTSNISGEKTEINRGGGGFEEEDFWIVKMDSKGNIQWDKTIGGNDGDYLASLQQTSDGGYILGGGSASNISGEKTENSRGGYGDCWIVKLKANGKIQWDKTIGGDGSDWCSSIKEVGKNRYVAGGNSSSRGSGDKKRKSRGSDGNDFWLVGLFYKTGNHPLVETTEDIASVTAPNNTAKSFSLYPNPAKDVLHIQTGTKATISLTDASGKTVLTQTINSKGEMNTSSLKPGVYFVKNHAGRGAESGDRKMSNVNFKARLERLNNGSKQLTHISRRLKSN